MAIMSIIPSLVLIDTYIVLKPCEETGRHSNRGVNVRRDINPICYTRLKAFHRAVLDGVQKLFSWEATGIDK